MVGYGEARHSPSKVLPFIRKRHHYVKHLIGRGELVGACFLLPRYVSDAYYFTEYLAMKSDEEGLVRAECDGYDLHVRYDDIGLGHEVYITGSHEPHTTDAYRSELRQLSAEVDEPVVLEIGANIGYYTLMALDEVSDATIFAIEPVPSTAELLRRNLEVNGRSDRVDVTEGAISDTDGRRSLFLSEKSNHASINPKGNPTRRCIRVDAWSVQSFLNRKGVVASDVNAVRMDLEGYESTLLLGGFGEFLEETTHPFVLNIELHPRYIADDELVSIITFLEDRFELVTGHQHSIRGVLLATITELDDVLNRDLPWVELVLRRKR